MLLGFNHRIGGGSDGSHIIVHHNVVFLEVTLQEGLARIVVVTKIFMPRGQSTIVEPVLVRLEFALQITSAFIEVVQTECWNVRFYTMLPFNFLTLCCMLLAVNFLDARYADSNAAIIGELRDLDEVFSALGTDGRSTFSTVMLALEETKLRLANVTCVDLLIDPKRSLGYLQILDPF